MLVCLLCVCLCPIIDVFRVNAVREVWKSLKLKILSNYPLVKGKCVLDLLSQELYLITHCIACISFVGFLLRIMTSFFLPLPCITGLFN
jgi:hypothetical protein